MAFGGRNVGLHGSELDDAVDAALEAVGLAEAADRNPLRPRAAAAQAARHRLVLAMRTPVVVLDEPTIGQDARGIARIRAIVADLTRIRAGPSSRSAMTRASWPRRSDA